MSGVIKIKQGYRIKKWVVVAENGQTEAGSRKMTLKCLACGKVKEITAGAISRKRVADCSCKEEIPRCLPYNEGTACRARVTTCAKNAAGYCCGHCPDANNCADACLNKPEKCGSFYLEEYI